MKRKHSWETPKDPERAAEDAASFDLEEEAQRLEVEPSERWLAKRLRHIARRIRRPD